MFLLDLISHPLMRNHLSMDLGAKVCDFSLSVTDYLIMWGFKLVLTDHDFRLF